MNCDICGSEQVTTELTDTCILHQEVDSTTYYHLCSFCAGGIERYIELLTEQNRREKNDKSINT